MARLLLARGLESYDQIHAFLNPETMPDGDPFALAGMAEAVAVIRDAIEGNEKICVYGDYDADGVCATAILVRCLQSIGATVSWFIPNRHGEGYGIHPDRVRELRERGVTLLITVDNGIAAAQEIALAKSLGMRVVVTDHHRAGSVLPPADALVCASLHRYAEDVNDLCGAGVALQLARALGCEAELPWCLPLAALATVADMVRLKGENRKIVKLGMGLIGQNAGLLALQRVAGMAEGACDEGALGFILGPRLNVAGRMGDAARALRLLLCEDSAEADLMAKELEGENRRRKAEEERIFLGAARMLAEDGEIPPVIVLYGPDWSTGVMGIVAARLAEKHYRPVLLFAARNGELAGSGRSIPEVDLHALLSEHKDLLIRFGGHAGAAGLTIAEQNLPTLRQRTGAWLPEQFDGKLPVKTQRYDLALRPADCTLSFCHELQRLAPFGRGNEEPIFLLPDAALSQVETMGAEGKHLRAMLDAGAAKLRLVAFGEGEQRARWRGLKRADAGVRLRANSYAGAESANAYFVFLQEKTEKEEKNDHFLKITDAFYAHIRYNKLSYYFDPAWAAELSAALPRKLTEEELRAIYRQQREWLPDGVWVPRRELGAGWEEQAAALIFLELGFTRYDPANDRFAAAQDIVHRNLSESAWFGALGSAQ